MSGGVERYRTWTRIRGITLFTAGLTAMCLVAAAARADDFISAHSDFFKLLLDNRNDIRLRGTYEPERDEDGGPGKVEVRSVGVDGELAYPFDRDLFLRTGGEYDLRHLEFDRVRGARTELGSDTLHTVAARLGIGMFFSDSLLVTGSARFGAFTDFDHDLGGDDFRLDAETKLVYRFNPGALFLIGVEHSERYDDVELLPIVGVKLLSEDGRVSLNMTLPVEVRLGYHFTPRAEVYARLSRTGEQFRIDAGEEELDLYIGNQWVGLGAELWITDRLSITPEAGLSLESDFEFKSRNAGQFGGETETGGYVQVTLGAAL